MTMTASALSVGLRRAAAASAASSSFASAPRAAPARAVRRRTFARTSTSTSTSQASSSPSPAATSSSASATAGGGGISLDAAGRIFFPSLCAATFGLGIWQTRRYFEKVEMVAKREDDLTAEPLGSYDEWKKASNDAAAAGGEGGADEGPGGTAAAPPLSHRRVRLRGTFRHDDEVLVGPRGPPPGALADSGPNSGRGGGGGMSSGAQGYWVVTPFVVRDDAEGDAGEATADVGGAGDSAPRRRGWLRGFWGGGTSEPEPPLAAKPSPGRGEEEEAGRPVVWIHRGWIPRHFVSNDNAVATEWKRPEGVVRLTAVESRTEKAGTFAPPSRLEATNRRPNRGAEDRAGPKVRKLLWMDRDAMEEMTSRPADDRRPPLFAEVRDDDGGDGGGVDARRFPARPPPECAGEFKVPPATHAGYAVTWFGLSGAGIAMTRKLLTRGR
ncbi:hypothetical protein ACHAWF_012129 [Thalassiosira exigua]